MVLEEYGWNFDFGMIVKIFCVGCIICVCFLQKIIDVYVKDLVFVNLLFDLYFKDIVVNYQIVLCDVVVVVVKVGVLVLVFVLVVVYFDSYWFEWLFVNFVQVQCDFFGVYMFECMDKLGSFYVNWL